MEKLIIDRSKWRTGTDSEGSTGKGSTMLLNNHGYMCCLGFACMQLGVSENLLLGTGYPATLGKEIPLLTMTYSGSMVNTDFTNKAVEINDNVYINSSEREKRLTEHFNKKGIKVEFINEYKTN